MAPVQRWRENATRKFKLGTVHEINPDDANKSMCDRILVSDEPYHGLSPGEYCSDPVTCSRCRRAIEHVQIARLAEKYKTVANLDVEAAQIGHAWAVSLHKRGVRWAPWNPAKADPIALRKVATLCPDERTRVRLAGICLRAAMQHWQSLAPTSAGTA